MIRFHLTERIGMESYTPSTYGDKIADIYDEPGQTPDDAQDAADLLSRLAKLATPETPRLLEFGIGTGRIALPLLERGCTVTGVDCSAEMLKRCADADQQQRLSLINADMATVSVPDADFHVVYAAWNTLFHVLTQDGQVQVLKNAYRHLTPGGHLVVQGSVPDPASFQAHQRTRVYDLQDDLVDLDFAMHDPVHQILTTQYLIFRPDHTEFRPLKQRYFWPSELDLMARLAGLELVNRYGDWTGSRFTSASTDHISVYRRPDDARSPSLDTDG
jgi:ubiquinone/menaquinone biosynthesis C-methylase UbiE